MKACMHILLTLLCLSSCKSEVKVLLYFKDACTEEVYPLNGFVLSHLSANTMTSYYSKETNVVSVPLSGFYKLSVLEFREDIEFFVPEGRFFQDTLISNPVQRVMEATTFPTFSYYDCCDKPCDGWKVGNYPTGKRALEGFFVNGHPVEELKFYKLTGELERIEVYDLDGNLINTQKL